MAANEFSISAKRFTVDKVGFGIDEFDDTCDMEGYGVSLASFSTNVPAVDNRLFDIYATASTVAKDVLLYAQPFRPPMIALLHFWK